MKINWTVRLRNPVWWVQVIAAVFLPVLAYYGLTGADMTSWGLVWKTLGKAVSNPYVVVTALVSLWNAINDPTTAGVTDSVQALGYARPKSDKAA